MSAVQTWVEDTVKTVADTVSSAVNVATSTVSNVVQAVSDTANNIGTAVSNTVADAGQSVSDLANSIGTTVSNTLADVGQGVSDVIHDVGTTVAKSPILNTAAFAVMVANGVPPAVASAVLSANAGASPEVIARNMALAGIGSEIASQVAPEISQLSESQLFGQAAGQAAGSAATAAVSGKDPLAAALTSFVSSGANVATGEIVKDIPGFDNLPRAAQDSVRAAVSASLQGKDPTMAAVNKAMNAGVQEAVKYGSNIFNGSVTNIDQADFGTNQGAVDKVAEMEAKEREAEDAARAVEERRLAEEENIRLIEEERRAQETLPAIEPPTEPPNTYGLWTQPPLPGTPRPQVTGNFRPVDANEFWTPPTNPTTTEPQTEPPVEVPGEGGGTLTIDPKTGGVTVTEPELPNTEPPEEWTPPTDLPPPTTTTGIDNEGADLGGGDVFNLDEFYRSIGIDPSTMKDEPPMSQDDIDAIIRGENVPIETPTGTVNVFKGKVVPTTPAPKTPTNQPTTQPITQPTTQPVTQPTQQTNPLGMLALLDILGQSQQQPQAPQPVQGADIRLMEDIFGTNFITPRPEGTKKYSSGGEIEALLQLLRS